MARRKFPTRIKVKGGAIHVEGIQGIIRLAQRLQKERPEQVYRGLRKAGFFIKRESQKVTPVDTGFLQSSAYLRTRRKPIISIEIGYKADYAFWVHERLDVFHSNGQARFLTSTIRRYRTHIKYLFMSEIKPIKKMQ